MHHLYPLGKGDPLCPLGFHPQVRWPTRCKRCFRDYKEHGGKKKEEDLLLRRNDSTASSPNLSSWGSSQSQDSRRSWSSSTNLAQEKEKESKYDFATPLSWPSTPDLVKLEDCSQPNIPTVSFTLPRRTQAPVPNKVTAVGPKEKLFKKNDSLAVRVKKAQAAKETSQEKTRRIQIKELKASADENTNDLKSKPSANSLPTENTESDDDTISNAGTETTDTTLVGDFNNEAQDQIESLKEEIDFMKVKCDKLERDKSDLLLRRLASMETTPSKTTATEVLKLQQKCNELQSQLEDLKDDKKSLSFKVKELEEDVDSRPTAQFAQKIADELRSKLLAAETLCEELMDENEDIKKEMRDLEEEMEELQDNFREDQASEYSSLKKELEQTTKNCRILSFKLRKTERKSEQLEMEKGETEKKLREISGGLNSLDKVTLLERDLKQSTDIVVKLQKELEEANSKIKKSEESILKKKSPMLGSTQKTPSVEKVSRASLTRGGSQDDPVQLQRDLQDSIEREADLREQLKFAEEEGQNLRKKVSRIEDDNESLVLQLKKMASKAKTRRLSPNRSSLEAVEKTTIDEEDVTELKLLLELNEQEASVLRKKVEELEGEKEIQKKKIKELHDRLTTKTSKSLSSNSIKSNDNLDHKIKSLEDEANNLRKKLTEQERETNRLQSEVNLNLKRSKGMNKSKSLDIADEQTVDMKRQLQIIEQEATVLRTKVQLLESENEKIISENKKLQLLRGTKGLKNDKMGEKLIDKIAELEVELEHANKKIEEIEGKSHKEMYNAKNKVNDEQSIKQQLLSVENERDNLADTLKALKENFNNLFKNRTPKKPSDFTSKVQLKNMIGDLEKEIGEISVLLNNFENIKSIREDDYNTGKLKTRKGELEATSKDLEEFKSKLALREKELDNEKLKNKGEQIKYESLNETYSNLKVTVDKYQEENKQLLNKLELLDEQYKTIINDKESIENERKQLKSDLKSLSTQENEFLTYKEQTKNLQSEFDKKEKALSSLQKELLTKDKDLQRKSKKLEELEKQLSDNEDSTTKSQKQNKEQLKVLSQKLDDEQRKFDTKEAECIELNAQLLAEARNFKSKIEELNTKIKSSEKIISSKDTLIQQLEESVKKEREAITNLNKNINKKELSKLNDDLNKSKARLIELEATVESTNKSKKNLEDKLKEIETNSKTEKANLEKKISELQNEIKKSDLLKINREKENKNREIELTELKNKIKTLESASGNKKNIEEYKNKLEKLEKNLSQEKTEYDNLTAKYEILEEEHVVMKAKLVMEKELLASQLSTVRQDLEKSQTELVDLNNSYIVKNENISKEKSDLQEKLKILENSTLKSSDYERERLKASLDERLSDLEQVKREYDVVQDQMEYLRKENDELKRKLEDYSKLSKIQRNISADTSAMDKEMKQLRIKLSDAEKLRKTDVAQCKMRYDSQMTIINNEITSLQGQVTRFKRERDTYKHMLEGAQKTIGDLKTNTSLRKESRSPTSSLDEGEENRSKIATLEQQVSCMEDELSEARLEGYKLKTELVSERSNWEIKLSEMHSRVNELEEARILSSGRTKIPGLKTRMELAWQKEREEQQRLLQETSTLARDLRQTLFEVERERDKERLESKRKQEQLKKTIEEDQDENKQKLIELQCDLLELRDAHAKLRTTNEKLRREKERQEREREELKSIISGKKKSEHEDELRITAMLEQVDTLIKLAPEAMGTTAPNKDTYTPTPPRRSKGSKSRESSPNLERREFKGSSSELDNSKFKVQSVMSRLSEVTDEIRRYQRLNEESKDRERMKKNVSMRRATSIEHDNRRETTPSKVYVKNENPTKALHRRSLSLEHTIQQEQNIWLNNDSMSSLHSLDDDSNAQWKRDSSFDSRLSSGSTQSETVGGEKKKKGFMSKLKKLTKSKSIDDQDSYNPPTESLSSNLNSSSEIIEEKGSKKDIRERITGIFKRGGSSSRSNSMERRGEKVDTSSTKRPLMPNGTRDSSQEEINKAIKKTSKHK